jgi:steroid delta-isomerase-like uncharacterized protein
MAGSGTEVLQALADAINARDYDRIGGLLSDDVEFADVAAGQTVSGRDATLAVVRMWLGAFPDMRLEVLALVADERHGAGELVGRGTQDGTLVTPMGEIPPTGRRFEEPFTWFVDLSGGRVSGWRDYYNAMSLMMQLGLIPEPAEAA